MFIYLMSPPDNGHTGRFQFLDIYINNSAVTRFGPFLDQKKKCSLDLTANKDKVSG